MNFIFGFAFLLKFILAKDFVVLQELNKFRLSHNDEFYVYYGCRSFSYIIGFEIVLKDNFDLNSELIIFEKQWKCLNNSIKTNSVNAIQKKIKVKFPFELKFKADYLLKNYYFHHLAEIRIWMLEIKSYFQAQTLIGNHYRNSKIKSNYLVNIVPPYSRPSIYEYVCLNFLGEIFYKIDKSIIYKSDYEQEIVKVIDFPLVLIGKLNGILKSFEFKPFMNLNLDYERQSSAPKSSYLFWIYISDYCEYEICSILHHVIDENIKITPSIYIKQTGQIIIEVQNDDQTYLAFTTIQKVPIKDWCRLLILFKNTKWELFINCMSNFEETLFSEGFFTENKVIYDDTFGIFYIGGCLDFHPFHGFIGQLTIYRNRIIEPKELTIPSNTFIFELNERKWEKECQISLKNISYFKYLIDLLNEYSLKKNTCHTYTFITNINSYPMCRVSNKLSSAFNQIDRSIYNHLKKRPNDQIGEMLFDRFLNEIDLNEFQNIDMIINILKQSSCLNYHESSYFLSIIYSHGIRTESNKILANIYLFKGAINNDRLCLSSLASKHFVGTDEFSLDYDTSYYYYRHLSSRIRFELMNPIENENFPINLKLNESLDSFMSENSDYFSWLKYLTTRGVSEAQNNLANILFWGLNGIKRNLNASIELFSDGAKKSDPESLYNYGIFLMNGLKNTSEAQLNFENSAKLGYSAAYAALGFNAYFYENNLPKAIEYWNEGWDKYSNIDCAFNLGVLWESGQYLNESKNLTKALEFFSYSASNGQFDSQVKISDLNAHGNIIVPRNSYLAAIWSRIIAEKTSILGKHQYQAIEAYKNQNWSKAIILFLAVSYTEIGSFNAAYLFDELSHNGFTDLKDFVIHFYNQSMLMTSHYDDKNSYCLLKLADYYYLESKKNNGLLKKAIDFYTQAYLNGEPQALFNIANLIENENYEIPDYIWLRLQIKYNRNESKYAKIASIYQRCFNDEKESSVPCAIALIKIKILEFFTANITILIVTLFITLATCLLIFKSIW